MTIKKNKPNPFDIINQEISCGDIVCFNPPKYKGLRIGVVVKVLPSSVTIDYGYGYEMNGNTCNRPSRDVIKVSSSFETFKIENVELFV